MNEEKKIQDNIEELNMDQVEEVSGGAYREPYCYTCKICGMKFLRDNRKLNYLAHMSYEHGIRD